MWKTWAQHSTLFPSIFSAWKLSDIGSQRRGAAGRSASEHHLRACQAAGELGGELIARVSSALGRRGWWELLHAARRGLPPSVWRRVEFTQHARLHRIDRATAEVPRKDTSNLPLLVTSGSIMTDRLCFPDCCIEDSCDGLLCLCCSEARYLREHDPPRRD